MRPKLLIVLVLMFFGNILGVNAAVISATTTHNSGTNYTTTYTVTPSSGDAPIEEFTIFFTAFNFANLALAGSPASFDPLIIQPDTAVPADGFADFLALSSPIAFGDSLGGFSVSYDFAGAGGPGSQAFDIIDPVSFRAIASGFTEVRGAGTDVPEPATLALMLLGAAGLLSQQRRARKTGPAVLFQPC